VPSDGADADIADNCSDVANRDQLDTDCDGVGDVCDVCPDVSDPGQEDRDSDGIGDACDTCPDDADDGSDPDRDGVADACDLCPGLHSSGNNCNAEAEEATGATPRGDECDPTPCGDTVSITASPESDDGLHRFVGNNHFAVDGLAAFDGRGPGTFGMRFCACPVATDDSPDLRDTCASLFGCVVPARLADVVANYDLPHDDTELEGWKPIETAEGVFARAGLLEHASDDPATPEDESVFVVASSTHTLSGTLSFGARACAPGGFLCFPDYPGDIDVTWLIDRDIRRFLPPGTPPPFHAELEGVAWTHVERRPIFCGLSTCPPLDQTLSSNYWSGRVREQTVRVPFPAPVDPIVPGLLPGRACPECGHQFPDPWLVDPCFFDLDLCERPTLSARFPGQADLDVTEAFSPFARTALLDESLDWIAPSEPLRMLSPDTPVLAAVSRTGDAFGSRLVAGLDGTMRVDTPNEPIPPPIEPPFEPVAPFPQFDPGAREGHGVAYWASRQRVIVAGGRRLDTGELARDVWAYWFSDETWVPVPVRLGSGPAIVLAATVDYTTSSLVVLDVVEEARPGRGPGSVERVRLLRIDLELGDVVEIASWPRLGRNTAFGLGTSPDGTLYLVASHDRARRWLVLRVAIDDGHVRVLGHARGAGALEGRPHGSGAGISFLVRQRDGSLDPTGVGIAELRRPLPFLLDRCF